MTFHDSIRVASNDYFGVNYTIGCSRLETLLNNDLMDLVSWGYIDVDILVNDYKNYVSI